MHNKGYLFCDSLVWARVWNSCHSNKRFRAIRHGFPVYLNLLSHRKMHFTLHYVRDEFRLVIGSNVYFKTILNKTSPSLKQSFASIYLCNRSLIKSNRAGDII